MADKLKEEQPNDPIEKTLPPAAESTTIRVLNGAAEEGGNGAA